MINKTSPCTGILTNPEWFKKGTDSINKLPKLEQLIKTQKTSIQQHKDLSVKLEEKVEIIETDNFWDKVLYSLLAFGGGYLLAK